MPFLPIHPGGRFHPTCLFRPVSVAVIGAGSPDGNQVLDNLRAGSFAGKILVAADAAAIPALPVAPDLAVIATPPDTVPSVMAALAAKGSFAAIVIGAADGLAEASRQTGVRVLGPGSFGLAVPGIGLNASRAHLPPPAGRLGLVSQSAALCRAVLDWASPNGVGFSHIVGIGGNTDIGFGIVLDWLSRDAGTGAILLDIRHLKDRRAFLSAARAASRLRPVVAIGPGSLLADPTGEAERAFEAALRRAGVLCVTRLEDLLAAAETLTRTRPVRSDALAIISNATSAGRMAADAALRDGLHLAPMGGSDDGIRHVEPDASHLLAGLATEAGAAPEVGGVLVVHAPAGADDAAAIAALAACRAAMRVPLLVCAMGETTGGIHRRSLAEAGVAVFATPEQAVRCIPASGAGPPQSRGGAGTAVECGALHRTGPQRGARNVRCHAAGRPPRLDAGRGAGGVVRLRHSGGAEPRGRVGGGCRGGGAAVGLPRGGEAAAGRPPGRAWRRRAGARPA